MKLFRFTLLVGLCLSFIPLLIAQAPELSVSADNSSYLIGQQANIKLKVTYRKDLTASLLPLPDSFGRIELIGMASLDSSATGNLITLVQNFRVTAFDSVTGQIPPLPLVFSRNGVQDTAYSPALPMRFMLPPLINNDSTYIAANRPLIAEPWLVTDALPYILAGLGLLLLVFISWFIFRRRRKNAVQLAATPTLLPHEVALQKLQQLEKAGLLTQGKIKDYYSEMTFILREYAEHRFGIPALETTTGEQLRYLSTVVPQGNLLHEIGVLYQTADLVKFAKAEPDPHYHEEAMRFAFRWIETTRPAEPDEANTLATDTSSEAS